MSIDPTSTGTVANQVVRLEPGVSLTTLLSDLQRDGRIGADAVAVVEWQPGDRNALVRCTAAVLQVLRQTKGVSAACAEQMYSFPPDLDCFAVPRFRPKQLP